MKLKYFIALIVAFTLNTITAQESVNWITFPEAIQSLKTDPKPIIVDIYATWCGSCKAMEKENYENPTVAKYINENFYAVKLNAEHKKDIVVDGAVFKFEKDEDDERGHNELALALMGGSVIYPTTVFLADDSEYIDLLQSQVSSDKMIKYLEFISTKEYKTKTWEKFHKLF